LGEVGGKRRFRADLGGLATVRSIAPDPLLSAMKQIGHTRLSRIFAAVATTE